MGHGLIQHPLISAQHFSDAGCTSSERDITTGVCQATLPQSIPPGGSALLVPSLDDSCGAVLHAGRGVLPVFQPEVTFG